MVSSTEPKVNQSNAFKLYLPPNSWRAVRRLSGGISVASKGVAAMILMIFFGVSFGDGYILQFLALNSPFFVPDYVF